MVAFLDGVLSEGHVFTCLEGRDVIVPGESSLSAGWLVGLVRNKHPMLFMAGQRFKSAYYQHIHLLMIYPSRYLSNS